MKLQEFTFVSTLVLLAGAAFTLNAHAADLNKLYENAEAAGLSYHVLSDALNSYAWAKAKGDVHNPNILTVIDYTKPSTQKRLWVLDLKTDKVLIKALVAHGADSGYIYARRFSNVINSDETSLGTYTTALHSFYGHYGRSLKVYGLETGINNNAHIRDIEIHPAKYVTEYDIREFGRIGRTDGCFGLNPRIAERIVNETVGGSVLFAYALTENTDPVVAS